jgi:hypothetical protein
VLRRCAKEGNDAAQVETVDGIDNLILEVDKPSDRYLFDGTFSLPFQSRTQVKPQSVSRIAIHRRALTQLLCADHPFAGRTAHIIRQALRFSPYSLFQILACPVKLLASRVTKISEFGILLASLRDRRREALYQLDKLEVDKSVTREVLQVRFLGFNMADACRRTIEFGPAIVAWSFQHGPSWALKLTLYMW